MLSINPIPAFDDNYIWCLDDGQQAVLVDPGDAEPCIAALKAQKLSLAAVLITHHHYDHVGGLAALSAAFPALQVFGPKSSTPEINQPLKDGDTIEVLGLALNIKACPGHTLDHIAYVAEDSELGPMAFVGDTLFAGGCGRVFEGTPAQMHDSLSVLAALSPETQLYCAHEYTTANLQFAQAVEPNNARLAARIADTADKRSRNEPTVPSSLELELDTNPFLRSTAAELVASAQARDANARTPAEVFAVIRAWKDQF